MNGKRSIGSMYIPFALSTSKGEREVPGQARRTLRKRGSPQADAEFAFDTLSSSLTTRYYTLPLPSFLPPVTLPSFFSGRLSKMRRYCSAFCFRE